MECINYNGTIYARIMNPDNDLLFTLLEECRGLMGRYLFEKISLLPASIINRLHKKERKGLSMAYIPNVIEKSDIDSTVSEEDFLIANGFVPYERIKKVLDFFKPGEEDRKDLRRAQFAEKENVVKHVFRPDDHVGYLDNLAFFSLYINDPYIDKCVQHQEEIFEDKGLSKMLDRFRVSKERELDEIYQFLSSDCDQPMEKSFLSEEYKRIILEQLEYF